MLDVKQIVRAAVEFVVEMYKGEGVSDLRLEEIERSEDQARWAVTLSFARPDAVQIAQALINRLPRRDYKTLIVNGADGTIESMKIRELESSKAP